MSEKISKRIEAVIKVIYGGNVARAAMDLGVNRSTLSRYVLGGIAPTKQSLILLSKLHGLDLNWLQSGPGVEVKYDPSASTSVSSRPVTATPSTTVPNQNSIGFAGNFRQVQPFHNVADRYWFLINASIPDKQIVAGDYFLMRAVKPAPVKESDLGQLFMIMREGRVLFDAAKPSDVKGKTTIVGIALLMERDLAVM